MMLIQFYLLAANNVNRNNDMKAGLEASGEKDGDTKGEPVYELEDPGQKIAEVAGAILLTGQDFAK